MTCPEIFDRHFLLGENHGASAQSRDVVVEDFSPSDIAIDYGCYQPSADAWFLIALAIGLLFAVTWFLQRRQ